MVVGSNPQFFNRPLDFPKPKHEISHLFTEPQFYKYVQFIITDMKPTFLDERDFLFARLALMHHMCLN